MENIYYLPTHEYARIEGNIAYIGISKYAAEQLGNVVYVDMPEQGDDVTAGEDFGAIESVKAASDLFAPVSGAVIEANEELIDNPRLINEDPETHWIIKVEMNAPAELDMMLKNATYGGKPLAKKRGCARRYRPRCRCLRPHGRGILPPWLCAGPSFCSHCSLLFAMFAATASRAGSTRSISASSALPAAC